MIKRRKLLRNEKRVVRGFKKKRVVIVKPKNYSSWKKDKKYDYKLKAWVPNREYQFTEGRYRNVKSLKVSYPKKKVRKEVQTEIIKDFKIRKQVVLNFRSHEEPYYISIRAITINPDINEKGLLLAVKETLNNLSYNLTGFSRSYYGIEKTRIPYSEDKRLNSGKVYVEVWIKRNKPLVYEM